MDRRPLSARSRLVVTLACVLGSALLAEWGVRFLVFDRGELARNWGTGMRRPGVFADPYLEDEFWRLLFVQDPEASAGAGKFDPLLGWVGQMLEPETYRHTDLTARARERPILLYGASFANCQTAPEDCFQVLLEEARLGADFDLVNYGVGGYGIDQIYLLLRETIDHSAGDDPVVVIGAVADSDFERASLGFRMWPKPALRVVDGQLVARPVDCETGAQYLDRYGIGIRSYAWRGLLHSTGCLPHAWRDRLAGGPAKRRAQEELLEAIVLAIRDELVARDLRFFFLLFHSPYFLEGGQSRSTLMTRGRPSPAVFLTELFERCGVPYVDTLPYVLQSQIPLDEFYIPSGLGKNHPTAAGNRVLLEALCDGVERFAGSE